MSFFRASFVAASRTSRFAMARPMLSDNLVTTNYLRNQFRVLLQHRLFPTVDDSTESP